jgi:hypothetical protein
MNKPVDKDSLKLNQPKRTPGHPTKSHIVKTKVDGKEKIIRFGQQGASTAGKPKEGESDRMTAKRASFKARHSANIAKGPSSAAYWANKVKWADGGSVRTNYADGDSVQATPQQPVLGSIANFLKKSYSPERTQQMQGTMEFLGVPALARTIERKSYGFPITNYGVANVPLIPGDTAEAAMAVAEAVPVVGPLAKVARKGALKGAKLVGEELNRAILDNSGALARFVPEAAKPMYVVKPKGGNWLSGSIEDVISPLKPNVLNEIGLKNLSERAGADVAESVRIRQEPAIALNKWVDQKLGNYIKNDMATPEDPLRALAEEWSVDKPAKLAEVQSRINEFTKKMAQTARERGVPVENLTQMRQEMIGLEKEKALIEAKEALHANVVPRYENRLRVEHQRPLFGQPAEGLAKSEPARRWEIVSDAQFLSKNAQERAKDEALLADNPWLLKVPPETQVYGDFDIGNINSSLGFDHLIDELSNAINPESGLPKNLLIDPKDLNKMTMTDVVDKVSDINAWRATQKAEANKILANNEATVLHKEYQTIPGTDAPNESGLRWVQFKPDETLPKGYTGKQEGDEYVIRNSKGEAEIYHDNLAFAVQELRENRPKLFKSNPLKEALKYEGDTMQHCVGGYCDDVASGVSKIFSLRDSKGMPHTTVEVVPSGSNTIRQMNEGNPTSFDIEQIKGRRNEAPEEEYLPFVLDFLNSSEWGKVKDIDLYDIIDVKDPKVVQRTLKDVLDYDLPHERVTKFNKAVELNPEANRFMSLSQFKEFVDPNFGKEGFAAGGSVSVYDPDKIDEIMNSLDEPTGYADGGTVTGPDFDFKEDPETLRLYKHAMKQFMPNQEDTISTVSTGVQGRVGGGDLSAGIDMNRMTKGQQDQLMKSIAASYNVDLGDVNLNTRLEAPLDAKDIYVGMINGSIPIGEGRAMLGVQGIKTPYGSDVLGYNAGYSGKVGPGRLNVNVNKPKRGKPSAQMQYQIPFAEGGSVIKNAATDFMKFLDAQGLSMSDVVAAFGKRGMPLSAAFYSGDLNTDEDLELRKRRKQKPTIDQPKFAKGGSVTAYDPDQVDAIANQYM